MLPRLKSDGSPLRLFRRRASSSSPLPRLLRRLESSTSRSSSRTLALSGAESPRGHFEKDGSTRSAAPRVRGRNRPQRTYLRRPSSARRDLCSARGFCRLEKRTYRRYRRSGRFDSPLGRGIQRVREARRVVVHHGPDARGSPGVGNAVAIVIPQKIAKETRTGRVPQEIQQRVGERERRRVLIRQLPHRI